MFSSGDPIFFTYNHEFYKKGLNNWILFLHQKGLIWGGKKLQKQLHFFNFLIFQESNPSKSLF